MGFPPLIAYRLPFGGVSAFFVSSSVLDEHPLATPQVGKPAFRMMNCSTSQMPMTASTVPMVSMVCILSRGKG
jgi:hypothetical protein